MTDPISLAAIALTQRDAHATTAYATPPAIVADLQRQQRVQAEKARLDQILRQLRQQQVHPETAPASGEFVQTQQRPQSGSQLFAQRVAALAAGQVHSRLPSNALYQAWQGAVRQPTYEQWRSLLVQEAHQVQATAQPIGILLGDSLSLWFPSDRLPSTRLWLNQGISGDTTHGILDRLSAFRSIQPQIIYLMAGVNDLKQGASDRQIVQNIRAIIQRLRQQHPQTQIVVQSIVPPRSLSIASQRIMALNHQLQAIANQHGAYYLDVSARMVDQTGYLRTELTTDGLHFNAKGYAVWQSVLNQAETYMARR